MGMWRIGFVGWVLMVLGVRVFVQGCEAVYMRLGGWEGRMREGIRGW